jgi:hypothetical protein
MPEVFLGRISGRDKEQIPGQSFVVNSSRTEGGEEKLAAFAWHSSSRAAEAPKRMRP